VQGTHTSIMLTLTARVWFCDLAVYSVAQVVRCSACYPENTLWLELH
jgi:hypothetical protein